MADQDDHNVSIDSDEGFAEMKVRFNPVVEIIPFAEDDIEMDDSDESNQSAEEVNANVAQDLIPEPQNENNLSRRDVAQDAESNEAAGGADIGANEGNEIGVDQKDREKSNEESK